MRFLKILEKITKKKKYNIGIIRFGDNIVIPGRDYFRDENKIKLLEEYKKHYIEELSKRTVITTLNFNSNKLKQDMNMNVDLILRNLLDNEDFNLFAPEELIIQSLKLKMYYEEIKVLEEETILRLVALKEIEKSKKIARHNRMALAEEINQLSTILEMYSYRKSAVNIELKNYFDVLSTKNLKEQDPEIFKQRLDRLLFITCRIVDYNKIKHNKYIKTSIAILERECEKYAYLNKEEAYQIKNSFDLSSEGKILLFYEYGKNYYDEEFIKQFYLYKFNIRTSNINNRLDNSPFNKTINKKDYGFEYYKDIIAYEIENIQNSYYFSKLSNNKQIDIVSLLENFKNYLKNKYNEFDYEEILLNEYKLSFILSFKYENGLRDFFCNNILYLEVKKKFSNVAGLAGIEWCDELPLTSLFEFMTEDKNNPLYSFYILNKTQNNLLIPEGVKTVDFRKMSPANINKIKTDMMKGKNSFPETLESVSGYIDYKSDILSYNLNLNYGLEYIGSDIFKSKIYKISIPSSIKKIITEGNGCNVDCIEFRDFKNSEILKNKENFEEFIKICSTEFYTGKNEIHYPSKRNLEIQERYRKGGYTTSNHAALYDRKHTRWIYNLKMLFSEIIFTSDDIATPVIIHASDLETSFHKEEWMGTRNLYGIPNYWEVYSKIREIIKAETGYDISENIENKRKKLK